MACVGLRNLNDKVPVITRWEGGEGGRKGTGGQRVMEGDLTWGGEHTIQYTDDVS